MSLYNMLHGFNYLAVVVLAMIGKKDSDFGRFRDAYINEDGTLTVFTRCGGGNRGSYPEVFKEMYAHPNFLREFDDDYDCTYASFVFSVPEQYRPLVDALKPKEPIPDLHTKTMQALEAIGKYVQKDAEKIANDLKEMLNKAIEKERTEKVTKL